MPERAKFENIAPEHPTSMLANALSGEAANFSRKFGVSIMDVCVAMANACGHILADAAKAPTGCKPLPRDEALKRMDDLRKVMEAAYDLRDVGGSA